MYFNTPNNPEKSLYHDCQSRLGLSDTTTLPLTTFCRWSNKWYRRAKNWIFATVGEWQWDDAEHTDLPIATTDLKENQQDYELPEFAEFIERVTIKDENGDWQTLEPFDISQISQAPAEFLEEPGTPVYYDLKGRSIFLYPKPDADVSGTSNQGLKVYFSRDIKEFSITDTNSQPGFAQSFHAICSVGPAYDYAITYGLNDLIPGLKTEINELKQEIQTQYGNDHKDFKVKIIPSNGGSLGDFI